MGLSMGGSLSLRLAELRGDAVRGLVLVNPSVHSENKALVALPLLKHVVPVPQGIGNDIAKPGQDEGCYDRVPLKALHSLTQGWAHGQGGHRQGGPARCCCSAAARTTSSSRPTPPGSSSHVRSTDLTERVLPNSYHVATLDNDAPEIFAGSLDFVRRLRSGPAGA